MDLFQIFLYTWVIINLYVTFVKQNETPLDMDVYYHTLLTLETAMQNCFNMTMMEDLKKTNKKLVTLNRQIHQIINF